MPDIPGNRTACNNNMNITKLLYLGTDVSIVSPYFQTRINLKYKITSISLNYKVLTYCSHFKLLFILQTILDLYTLLAKQEIIVLKKLL